MIGGLLKIIVVASTFLFVYIAELSYSSNYYYANGAIADCITAMLAISVAIFSRSNIMLFYALVYIISASLHAFFYMPSAREVCYYLFYEAELNFSMIITFADCLIITIGGINAFYRLYTLRRDDCSSDDMFDARVGLHQWAE